MATEKSSAPYAHPSIEEDDDTVEAHYSGLERLRPCACMNGTVFIGHLVLGEDGEEVEVFEAVGCCRCFNEAYNRRGPGPKCRRSGPGVGQKSLIWGRLLPAAAAGLLAAVGLVVVLYAQPAEANFPGKPGKIAYAGYDGQDNEIYTINAGGGGKLNVTDNSTSDYDPAYSPSGKRIAFEGLVAGDSDIYTIKPDGGGRLNVTDNSSSGDYFPDYAPGGKRIAYTNNSGPDEEIYTIKPDGGSRQPVTDNANYDRDPYWGSQ